jgi:hypothetical protein
MGVIESRRGKQETTEVRPAAHSRSVPISSLSAALLILCAPARLFPAAGRKSRGDRI